MFILLIIASLIYFVLGEPRDGIIMLIFVIGIIMIDIIQEWKTDKTLKALKDLSQPKVKALSEAQIKRLYAIGNAAGYDFKKMNELINKKYNKEIKNLTKDEYSYICNSLEKNK